MKVRVTAPCYYGNVYASAGDMLLLEKEEHFNPSCMSKELEEEKPKPVAKNKKIAKKADSDKTVI